MDTLTAEAVRTILDYDADSGALIWKARPDRSPQWNGQFAGNEAGYIMRTGYRLIEIADRPYLAHRLAWVIVHGYWPTEHIDHINGIRADNRQANLREATQANNGWNQKKHDDGSSGYKGVSLYDAQANGRLKSGLMGKRSI